MKFENIDQSNKYLDEICSIIRIGIKKGTSKLVKSLREGLKTQPLVESFNIIGTNACVSDTWIGVQKEHERKSSSHREDIYFHLNDDNHTRIFYAEAKRLPKYQTNDGEEYVTGINSSGNAAGGIERYKKCIHGDITLRNNGMIAFVENKSIDEWILLINTRLKTEYPKDSLLIKGVHKNEFESKHLYHEKDTDFCIYHFWIDLTDM